MADRPPPSEELVTSILTLAIGAAGVADDLHAWRGRLANLIPEIVATVSPGSREHSQVVEMMTAVVLSAEYLGFEFNDRSTRCKVHFKADHSRKDEPEHVWSERTDTPRGAAQLAILRQLTKGCKVLIWKGTEQISDEQKVRAMYHIMRLDAEVTERAPTAGAPASAGTPPPADAPPSRPTPPPERAETPPPEPSPAGEESKIPPPDLTEALERLSGNQRVKVARWAKEPPPEGAGVLNLYAEDLSAESRNAILAYIELLIGGMT